MGAFWELNEVENIANHYQAKGKIENLIVLKIQVSTCNDTDSERTAQDHEFGVEI